MSEFARIEQRRSHFHNTINAGRRKDSKNKQNFKRLRTWENIPDFLRDNEFIRTGYRVNFSKLEALKSLFQFHNETFNVWTHLLGALIFLRLTVFLATGPGAPLAHPKESLENLWLSVQDNIHAIEDRVHLFHDTFDLHIGLLHATVHDSLNLVKFQLHQNFEQAQESLHVKMDPLRSNLKKSFVTISERLFMFQDRMGHMAGSMNAKLSAVRSNLEKSFNSVEESLSSFKNDLTGDLSAARSRLMKSLLSFQESIHGLQNLLKDTPSKQPTTSFNTTEDELPQCENAFLQQSGNDIRGHEKIRVNRWPVFLYNIGVMVCFLVSSICHLFACCSIHASKYMWKLDYAGISLLIVTSYYPPIYYGFLCQPYWVATYLIISTLLGVGTTMISLSDHLQKTKFRALRATMFATFGLFGIVPWAHQCLINFHEPVFRKVIQYELVMAAFYLGGTFFFVFRFPERWRPGRFDIILSSHQIFHVLVFSGAYAHFQVVKDLMEWRESTNGCPIPLS